MNDNEFDKNDSPWLDGELIWPAVLMVVAIVGLIVLFLWGGW